MHWSEQKKKGDAIIITGFSSSARSLPATATVHTWTASSNCKSYTIFSSFRFKRDEHGNYWKRKLCMCIRVSLRNSFPPLLPSSSPPSFLKKRIAKWAERRGVGDDLDIPSRAVVSWKFTLTSTKDLCAFHRVRARKRKFDRVWSWMYSNDLEYLRAFLVGQGASLIPILYISHLLLFFSLSLPLTSRE